LKPTKLVKQNMIILIIIYIIIFIVTTNKIIYLKRVPMIHILLGNIEKEKEWRREKKLKILETNKALMSCGIYFVVVKYMHNK